MSENITMKPVLGEHPRLIQVPVNCTILVSCYYPQIVFNYHAQLYLHVLIFVI